VSSPADLQPHEVNCFSPIVSISWLCYGFLPQHKRQLSKDLHLCGLIPCNSSVGNNVNEGALRPHTFRINQVQRVQRQSSNMSPGHFVLYRAVVIVDNGLVDVHLG
jgi:hypothetical protein